MSSINFITSHTISKIMELIKNRQSTLKHDGFLYFNEPIKSQGKKIDRVNRLAYEKEQILPVSFYHLKGEALVEMYKKLKSNDFSFIKKWKMVRIIK